MKSSQLTPGNSGQAIASGETGAVHIVDESGCGSSCVTTCSTAPVESDLGARTAFRIHCLDHDNRGSARCCLLRQTLSNRHLQRYRQGAGGAPSRTRCSCAPEDVSFSCSASTSTKVTTITTCLTFTTTAVGIPDCGGGVCSGLCANARACVGVLAAANGLSEVPAVW